MLRCQCSTKKATNIVFKAHADFALGEAVTVRRVSASTSSSEIDVSLGCGVDDVDVGVLAVTMKRACGWAAEDGGSPGNMVQVSISKVYCHTWRVTHRSIFHCSVDKLQSTYRSARVWSHPSENRRQRQTEEKGNVSMELNSNSPRTTAGAPEHFS